MPLMRASGTICPGGADTRSYGQGSQIHLF